MFLRIQGDLNNAFFNMSVTLHVLKC